MSITPLCKHCGRLIRSDSRAYAANEGFYHWECTEPPMGIQTAEIAQGDTVVLETQRALNMDQIAALREGVGRELGVKVLVLYATQVKAVLKTPNEGLGRTTNGVSC